MGWRAIFAVLAVSVTLAWYDACRSLRFAGQAAVARAGSPQVSAAGARADAGTVTTSLRARSDDARHLTR